MLGPLALLFLTGNFRRVTRPADSALTPLLDPLPQDPSAQVFFNQSEAAVYTDPYRQIERYGDDLEQVIITSINQATDTVDVAVQELNLPRVAQALVDSAKRGVQVRLILEEQYSEVNSEVEDAQIAFSSLENALQILDQGRIARIDDTADGSRGSGLMHHKFIVIDQRRVIASSANFTLSGIHGDMDTPSSRGNANAVVKIEDSAIARAFTTEFEHMWGDGPNGAPDSKFGLDKPYRHPQSFSPVSSTAAGRTTLQFSPTSATQPWHDSVNGLIAKTLSQSSRSVDMALFVFSEQKIVDQLALKSNAGTVIRALIDPGFTYRSYSEALDMMGVAILGQNCQIEDNNQLWQPPITSVGYPSLPYGDKLHHKFAVVDGNTVIFGSQNWSYAANTKNDETLLVIENATVAKHFEREFERLYREPTLGDSAKLQAKIADAKQRCQ